VKWSRPGGGGAKSDDDNEEEEDDDTFKCALLNVQLCQSL